MEFIVDQLDIQILHLLEKNAFLSSREIGKTLGRSNSAIAERIQQLQKSRIITRYAATIDYHKISNLFISFILVRISNHSSAALTEFKTQLVKFEEILECEHVTGYYNFILKVAVQHMPAYNLFMGKKLGIMPNLAEVLSLPVLEELKRETNYPIFSYPVLADLRTQHPIQKLKSH